MDGTGNVRRLQRLGCALSQRRQAKNCPYANQAEQWKPPRTLRDRVSLLHDHSSSR
jgi:hypothetical protein